MAKYTRQPLYKYDEPVSYEQLSGGINNDPSNGNIEDTELRDAVNVTYNSKTLEKRKGAKLYKDLRFQETDPDSTQGFVQMQGILTTPNSVFYIVVRDGHLYYSSLDVVNDTLIMIELPIYIDNKYFDGTVDIFDSEYVVHSLKVYPTGETDRPNPLLDQEGYIYYQENDEKIDYPFTELDDSQDVGLHLEGDSYRLILQNHRSVESIVYNDTMYIATGTRLLKITEALEDGHYVPKPEIVTPRKLNSWEYGQVGFNYLSPYPEQHVYDSSILNTSRITNIRCLTHHVFIDDTSTSFKVVMDFMQSTDANDYYFKWEIRNITADTDWETVVDYADGRGMEVFDLVHDDHTYEAGDIISIRASYSNDFFEDAERTTPDLTHASTGATYVSHEIETGTSESYEPEAAQKFLEIHTCNRILADGNKMILYGTLYGNGNWFKSGIDKFDYYTDSGQLNFQTHKNERIIACIHLQGQIIVFADNEDLGGTIHMVNGNGDDYEGDQYYSPYKRKLIHASVSCDHPNSVQYVENYVLFKYRSTIWLLDSRELNAERVNLISASQKINHDNPNLFIPKIPYSPRYESKLFSYVSDEAYVLVFPEYEMQWKMYYKDPVRYEDSNRTHYPWLRDLSPVLAAKGITTINNRATYLTDNYKLFQMTGEDYLDLGETFKMNIITKAWDLTYKNMTKFINNVQLNYSRGNTAILKLDLFVYNEGGIKLIGPSKEAFIDKYTGKVVYANKDNYYDESAHDMDKPSLLLGITDLGSSKIGIPYFDSKLFHSEKRFPLINASVAIESSSPEAFSLESVMFNYITSDMPTKTLPKMYSEILREE